jgi:hypothetical protein
MELEMRPTGHIRQRSPRSFEIRYSLGTDKATGKDRYATATVVGTRKDAERELRRRLRTLDTGEHVDPNRITLGKWLADWLATVRGEVAPKSYERYAEVVDGYLTPALGNLPLTKLTPRPKSRKPITAGPPAAGAMARKDPWRPAPAGIFIAF